MQPWGALSREFLVGSSKSLSAPWIMKAHVIRWAVSLAAAAFLLLLAPHAQAYAWMIRHGYTTCMPCHTDPSGASVLTPYGRAQGELLLSSYYGAKPEEASPDAAKLLGAIELPENLRLGGDVREAFLRVTPEGAESSDRWLLMRADLYGDLKLGRLRFAGSLGFSHEGALKAALTSAPRDNLVSREHWIGYELDEDASWLIRAGRIALPFGIRNIEHTLWVRNSTRTDLLDNQQHGVALSISKDWIRGEVMGILGNFQLGPDAYRERGYSAYLEVSPLHGLALGASSLFTRAERDINFHVTDYRQAHGLFARYAPSDDAPIVFMAEWDWLYDSLTWAGHRGGFAGEAQADFEPLQGFHLMVTGETKNGGAANESASYGIWGTAAWFFVPHADLRIDNIYQSLGSPAGSIGAFSFLAQVHVYL